MCVTALLMLKGDSNSKSNSKNIAIMPHYLRLLQKNGEKLKISKDIFDFAFFCDMLHMWEYIYDL